MVSTEELLKNTGDNDKQQKNRSTRYRILKESPSGFRKVKRATHNKTIIRKTNTTGRNLPRVHRPRKSF